VLGEQIELTASPEPGWQVIGWAGTGDDASTSTSNQVTMPASDHAVAVFYEEEVLPCYRLTRGKTGSGGQPVALVPSSPGCPSGFFLPGEVVELAASPDSGWEVLNWTGTDHDASRSTANTVTMPTHDHTALVNYVESACHARLNEEPGEYSSVQAAVDAASEGDLIKIAGYCRGVEARASVTQTLYLSKTVALQGGYSPSDWSNPDPEANPTTLDALGLGRVLYVTGSISPTIEGLRITGGDATGLGDGFDGSDAGGGVYLLNAAAMLTNNEVFSNTAVVGGGLYLWGSDSTLSSNEIVSNTAQILGGGLYMYDNVVALEENLIAGNHAGHAGGGAHLYFSDSTITGNEGRGPTLG
jgi:hypothetical protein